MGVVSNPVYLHVRHAYASPMVDFERGGCHRLAEGGHVDAGIKTVAETREDLDVPGTKEPYLVWNIRLQNTKHCFRWDHHTDRTEEALVSLLSGFRAQVLSVLACN